MSYSEKIEEALAELDGASERALDLRQELQRLYEVYATEYDEMVLELADSHVTDTVVRDARLRRHCWRWEEPYLRKMEESTRADAEVSRLQRKYDRARAGR